MRTENRQIEGPFDFELNRARTASLACHMTWPDEGTPKGLVFVIPGFGEDGVDSYNEHLREFVAQQGWLAVSADYHCLGARQYTGATVSLDPEEHVKLLGYAVLAGVKLSDPTNASRAMHDLAKAGKGVVIGGKLKPTREEYQNFGVLQAMDHLAVLADILKHGPEFDRSRVVAFGTSHGGFIAHLMAKLAPSSFSAVLDNSSYVQVPYHYIGLGSYPEFTVNMNGARIQCHVESGWTMRQRTLPNAYTRDADLIRDTGYPPHVQAMRVQRRHPVGLTVRMAVASNDTLATPASKQRQAHMLGAVGFDVDLDVVDETGIDGVVFKKLEHGLGVSLKHLFERWEHASGHRDGPFDCEVGAVVEYPCVDLGYRFRHSAEAPYIVGETYELYPMEEGAPAEAAALKRAG